MRTDARGGRWGAPYWLLAVMVIAATAAMAETYARVALWYWNAPRYVQRPLRTVTLHPDPRYVPGVAPVAHLRFDAMGLRSSDDVASRSPDILAIGSSTMECLFLDQPNTFPEQIARTVRERSGIDVVVSTAARSGMLTWHAQRYAQDLLARLPSVRCVVLMPAATELNRWLRGGGTQITADMEEDLYWGTVWRGAPFDSDGSWTSLRRFDALARSEGAKLLSWLGVRRGSDDEIDGRGLAQERWRQARRAAMKVELPDERLMTRQEALATYERWLGKALQSCLERDVEVVVATQPLLYAANLTPRGRDLWWSGNLGPKGDPATPYLTESAYHACLEVFNDVTRRVARRYAVPCVDLAAQMSDMDGTYFYDTLHFNDAGAALAGRIVGEVVTRQVNFAGADRDLCHERITYASSIHPELQSLGADVYFRRSWKGASHPIAVVMHGFHQHAGDVSGAARALRAEGFFVVAPEMRGRGGSDGRPDFGAWEIADIVDAVDAVRRRYADYVNPDIVVIEGFSGGGGNVLSAVCRFPDAWSAAVAWFPISDYGHDLKLGFYHITTPQRRETLRRYVGDATRPENRSLYAARNSTLSAMNARFCPTHLFVEQKETICPPHQSQRFVEAAQAAGLSNVTLHLGTRGLWAHGYPDWSVLFDAHRMIWPEGALSLSRVSRWSSRLRHEGQHAFIVPGYLRTSEFFCRIGDGASGVARLVYDRRAEVRRFLVQFQESRPDVVHLEVYGLPDGREYRAVSRSGQTVGLNITAPGTVRLDPVQGDCDITLTVMP